MGFISKIKTMFTEEVEDDTPITKEVIQVEIPAPQTEEVSGVKKEEKIVFFDDKDFDVLEKAKEKPKRLQKSGEVIEKKVFKPSPIISPVYGILDKNYHKDDITDKKTTNKPAELESINIDYVRKKAYGTLEDDLENSLFNIPVIKPTLEEPKESVFSTLDSLEEEISNSMMQEEIEPKEDLEEETSQNLIEEELNKEYDLQDVKEDDLFDLIDAMYEKGDE